MKYTSKQIKEVAKFLKLKPVTKEAGQHMVKKYIDGLERFVVKASE